MNHLSCWRGGDKSAVVVTVVTASTIVVASTVVVASTIVVASTVVVASTIVSASVVSIPPATITSASALTVAAASTSWMAADAAASASTAVAVIAAVAASAAVLSSSTSSSWFLATTGRHSQLFLLFCHFLLLLSLQRLQFFCTQGIQFFFFPVLLFLSFFSFLAISSFLSVSSVFSVQSRFHLVRSSCVEPTCTTTFSKPRTVTSSGPKVALLFFVSRFAVVRNDISKEIHSFGFF